MTAAVPSALYNFNGIQVTPSSISILDKTYFVSNITSISIETSTTAAKTETKFDGLKSPVTLGVGILFLIMWFVVAIALGGSSDASAVAAFPLFIGIVATALAFRYKTVVKVPATTAYMIALDTNSGRISAYSTNNEQEAMDIKTAIETSVSLRN